MDPFSALAIGSVAGIGSAVSGMQAQASQSKAAAKAQETNYKIALSDLARKTFEERRNLGLQLNKLNGQLRVLNAASGLYKSNTALSIQKSVAGKAAYDETLITKNAYNSAKNLQWQTNSNLKALEASQTPPIGFIFQGIQTGLNVFAGINSIGNAISASNKPVDPTKQTK